MSGLEVALRLAAGLVLILLNAFFVVTEFALTRVRQHPREEFEADPRLRLAWQMTERLEIHLTGCQLGISLTSILLGVLAEPAVSRLVGPVLGWVGVGGSAIPVTSVIVAVIVIQLAHKVWGEQAPTYLGIERPKHVARVTAPILNAWTKATYPVIWLGDGLAKWTLRLFGVEMRRSWTKPRGRARPGGGGYAELRRQMGEVLSHGELAPDRRREILNALAIETIPVREIMVPRDRVVTLRAGAPFDANLRVLAEHAHVRFPLVDGSLDDCVGIVYVPSIFRRLDDLRAGRAALDELAAPPVRVGPEAKVSEVIDRLQDEGQEVALVFEDGQALGLVTATDAFEAIAGELSDPFD